MRNRSHNLRIPMKIHILLQKASISIILGFVGLIRGYIHTTYRPSFHKTPRIWSFQTQSKKLTKSQLITLKNKKVRTLYFFGQVGYRMYKIVGGGMSLH